MMPDPTMQDVTSPASVFAAGRDDAWFADHPKAVWRVRPLLEGESPLSDAFLARQPDWRAYAVVIDHKRAGDKRSFAGRGTYPVLVLPTVRGNATLFLKEEAMRMVKWFARRAETPPPARGVAFLTKTGVKS
jgi:hypothetical protein